MKVEERQMDVTSTLVGEKIGMTIDDSALQHIMSVLTDLYSDPEAAVIREYSTNALDSHIEAGVVRPIEVTLPTALAPFFRVRDFGLGLDLEDIRNIYSRYGTSTKRESNDVVGMLGLGCKSALTYTDQFTLCGIKNGTKTQVSVSRDANGAGSMTIVSETQTNEPNGVEVIVPAKTGNRFEKKAGDFFRFWEQGTVLVNGSEVARVGGTWLTDDLLISDNLDKSYIVMGNVPYPMPNDYTIQNNNYYRAAAFVDIGTVHFTPSREALQMTTKTKQTLDTVRTRIDAERDKAFQREIDACATRPEALAKYYSLSRLGFQKNAEYRGNPMPVKLTGKMNTASGMNETIFLKLDRFGYAGKKGTRYSSIHLTQETIETFWVTNFPADHMSPYKRIKMDMLLNDRGLSDKRHFIMIADSVVPEPLWIQKNRIIDWNDIDAIVVPKEKQIQRNDGRPSGSYEAHVNGMNTKTLLAKDIDTKNPIFWAHGNHYSGGKGQAILKQEFPNATFVFLPSNRIEKFKRDFPSAENIEKAAETLARNWLKSLTPDQMFAMNLSSTRSLGFYQSLEVGKVNDPELKKSITLSQIPGVSSLMAKLDVFRYYGVVLPDFSDTVGDKYPLIGTFASYTVKDNRVKNHIYIYVNAVYAAEKEV